MRTKLLKDFIVLMLLGMLSVVYYKDILSALPLNMHLWRQTDSISFTYNYYKGASFLEPELHQLGADDFTTGKTVGEFPLFYYIIGNIWKITEESLFIYRFVQMLVLLTGLFFLYKSALLVLGDFFGAVFIVLLAFSSPVLAFYGVSFAMNGTAWALAFIGTYFYLFYVKKNSSLFFLLISFLFFTLGGLLKITAMILPIAFFGIFIKKILLRELPRKEQIYRLLFWVGIFFFVIAWYFGYVPYFNKLHGYSYTQNTFYPLWNMEQSYSDFLLKIVDYHLIMFFSRPVLEIVTVFIFFMFLFLWNKIPGELYLFALIVYLGNFSYFLLRGAPLSVHDYYWIAFVCNVIVAFVILLFVIKKYYPDIYTHPYFKLFLIVFTIYNIAYTHKVLRLKRSPKKVKNHLLVSKEFVEWNKWYDYVNEKNYYPYYEMRDSLLQWGILPQDKVLSFSDIGANISLYFLERKGWTRLRENPQKTKYILNHKQPKWLFIKKEDLKHYPYIREYIRDSVTEYKGIGIYRLSSRSSERE